MLGFFIIILEATIEFATGVLELLESTLEYIYIFYHFLDNLEDLKNFGFIYHFYHHLPFIILLPNT